MDMTAMSKQAKEEFGRAQRQVFGLLQEGQSTLKDAIKKVASEKGYGRAMTEQLCVSCSTGQSWHPIRSGKSLEDKTAQVEIVKSNEVTDEMFGPVEEENDVDKTAEARMIALPAQVPDYVAATRQREVDHVQKAASMLEGEPDGSEERAFAQHLRTFKQAADKREELRGDVRECGRVWNTHLKHAADVYAESGMEFDEMVRRASAGFGPAGVAYMETIGETLGQEVGDLSKDAGTYYMVDTESEPWATVGRGVEMMQKIARLMEASDELDGLMRKSAETLSDMAPQDGEEMFDAWLNGSLGYDLSENKMPPLEDLFAKGVDMGKLGAIDSADFPAVSPADFQEAQMKAQIKEDQGKGQEEQREKAQLKKERRELARKRKEELGGAIGSGVQEAAKGLREDTGPVIRWLMDRQLPESEMDVSTSFPADHIAWIRHQKARGMLNALISSDPVLSNRDPDEVIDAFNRVRNLRPDMVDHPMLMQAAINQLMRYSNQGDVDTILKAIKDAPEPEQMATA